MKAATHIIMLFLFDSGGGEKPRGMQKPGSRNGSGRDAPDQQQGKGDPAHAANRLLRDAY
jgi:hypothetical protein